MLSVRSVRDDTWHWYGVGTDRVAVLACVIRQRQADGLCFEVLLSGSDSILVSEIAWVGSSVCGMSCDAHKLKCNSMSPKARASDADRVVVRASEKEHVAYL